jgi:tetratricopeptide (TPR) repeat protein
VAPTYEAYLENRRGEELHVRREFESSITYFMKSHAVDSLWVFGIQRAVSANINLGNARGADSLLKIAEQYPALLTHHGRTKLRYFRAEVNGDGFGRYRAAREIALQTDNPIFIYAWGYTSLYINRPLEAIEAFRNVDPDSRFIDDWLGYWGLFTAAYHLIGDHESELEVARNGIARIPGSNAVHYYKLRALAALGDIDALHRQVEDIFALPSVPFTPGMILYILALELEAHGYHGDAQRLIDRAIDWYRSRSAGDAAGLRTEFGRALYIAKRWDESQRIFEALLSEDPDNIEYCGRLGVLYALQGQRDRALEKSERLRSIDGTYRYGIHTLWRARIAAALGEFDIAVSLLRETFAAGLSYGLWLHSDPAFANMRDYEPFVELLTPRG